jgi:hypothetical protein
MVSDEPYHDGTSPHSRYETDEPERAPVELLPTFTTSWLHELDGTARCERWHWRRIVTVWRPQAHPDHWHVVVAGIPQGGTYYASTAWLALSIARRELGFDVPPFCEECLETEGWGA